MKRELSGKEGVSGKDSGRERASAPPGPGRRWTVGRKREVVLRLLRGESLDAVSREVGVEVYRLQKWRDKALAGLDAGLKERVGDPLQAELDSALKRVGQLTVEKELLEEKIGRLEAGRPLGRRRSRR